MLQRSGKGAQEDFANFVRKMKVLDAVLGSQTDYSFQYDLQVPKEVCPVLRRDSLALHKGKRHLFRRHTSHPMVAYTQGRKVMTVRVDETLPCATSCVLPPSLHAGIPGNLPRPGAALLPSLPC